MVKWIGALLILFAGTAIGLLQAARLAERPRQLKQLGYVLQRLRTEIGFGYTPLPDALRRTAGHSPEPIASMLLSAVRGTESPEGLTFQECWSAAVEEHWPRTALKGGEKAALLRLGSALGISDREDQLRHLELAAAELKAEEEAAVEEQSRYGTMSKSLGILIAALVVILMV